MIQSVVKTNFLAYINTAANQIMVDANTPPTVDPHDVSIYLAKFTNDMTGDIVYCYPRPQWVSDRFSTFQFISMGTPDMYNGELLIELAGYWKYEFWEVFFEEDYMFPSITTAPSTETDVLPVAPENGVVKGLVAIGKMYVAEVVGAEEVQYTEYSQQVNQNYIYTQ
jgi:hypothetical protein|tara:strand:+ start:13140 stop:13640 length:501 start_codon:yes stop_codon:yes gene_type:complete